MRGADPLADHVGDRTGCSLNAVDLEIEQGEFVAFMGSSGSGKSPRRRTRTVSALLAVWTAFYGAFGVFRLGVGIDVGLFVATLGLGRVAFHAPAARALLNTRA